MVDSLADVVVRLQRLLFDGENPLFSHPEKFLRVSVRLRSGQLGLAKPAHFGWINYGVLCLYLLAFGWLRAKVLCLKQRSTEDFFKGGKRIPWWAAGMSIFATQLSAITYMAVPAKAFATDWTYMVLNMTILLAAPFIIMLFSALLSQTFPYHCL